MRASNSLSFPVVVVALSCAIGACDEPESTSSPASLPAESPGKVVFSDDFDDGDFRPEWSRGQGEHGVGQWRVDHGAVVGVDLHNDPLWLNKPLPKEVRIEFDVTALSPVGDLKVEVFGDGTNHESGYILIFGGWDNSLDVIARLDEHGQDRKSRTSRGVRAGYSYHMAVERTGATVKWFVNGDRFMTYQDPQPLQGPDHRHFAFNIWSAPARFDNVKVFDLSS